MKGNAWSYCIRSGFKNILHNKLFSAASTATIAACIFLFCLFFAIVTNVQSMAKKAETTVGITVFFDDDIAQEQVEEIGKLISEKPEIKSANYTSADDAWNEFKSDYFNNNELMAQAFAEDNPLSGSQSYEIFLNNIRDQQSIVDWLYSLDGVRQVNYSNAAVKGLSSLNRIISSLSAVIISVLLAVSVFLISNTISVAAQFRRRENEIMKIIGATNFMIRLPFLVEGVVLGFTGAAIPLIGIYLIYEKAVTYVNERFVSISTLFSPIPIASIFPAMIAVAMGLGVGVGFVVSFFTIRKSLKV
ncbi:cell division protein FtsX [Oribacterium sp. WCC10]|uniref:cell division protein FtsX n=1 Tax=Oribacterium sp. WCC10 TaxID=1855343 RepID=UPI000B8265D7|nr:permease-like cell division protein FtsX [Oribacterium sp. WCC10]